MLSIGYLLLVVGDDCFEVESDAVYRIDTQKICVFFSININIRP